MCRGCILWIGEKEMRADLVVLDMQEYYVIFGIDLLSTYCAVMGCFRKKVVLQSAGVLFNLTNEWNAYHLFPMTGKWFLQAKA